MTDLAVSFDHSSAPGDHARAAATRFMERTGNADLLVVLGLAPDPVIEARRKAPTTALCPLCGNKLPSHGVCRQAQKCRAEARKNGASA